MTEREQLARETTPDLNALIERLELHPSWRDSHGELNSAPNEAAQALRAIQSEQFAESAKNSPLDGEVREIVQQEAEWQPIETAPYSTPVEVRAGDMTFLARLEPSASMTSDEISCDQWQAVNEGEHPPCWSGGACWESNENECASLQPYAWRLPAAPAIRARGEG